MRAAHGTAGRVRDGTQPASGHEGRGQLPNQRDLPHESAPDDPVPEGTFEG